MTVEWLKALYSKDSVSSFATKAQRWHKEVLVK